jgi:hypothetical protein
MRAFLRAIVLGYFYCGIALGLIVWFSYMWGLNAAASADVPIAEHVKATLNVQPMVLLSSGTRTIAWGPSLWVWAATPNDNSFGKWLAPGFYVRRLS